MIYLGVAIIQVHIQPAVRGGEAGVSDTDEWSIEVLIDGHTNLVRHAFEFLFADECSEGKGNDRGWKMQIRCSHTYINLV